MHRFAPLLTLVFVVACGREPLPVNIPDSPPGTVSIEEVMEATTEMGEACVWNSTPTCGQEAYCLTYQDSPSQPEAFCESPREDESGSRLLGTVWDFGEVLRAQSMTPVADADVRFAAALDAAADIEGEWADPLAQDDADGAGRFDTRADLTDARLGVMAMVRAEGYFRTANAVAIPLDPQPPGCSGGCYGPANTLHDIFAVPEDLLATWSESLRGDDPYINERLPMGEQGGVVGFIRRLQTGKGLADAKLVSVKQGKGRIFYLNEDLETFNTEATTSTGAFVIIGPSLAEGFDVEYEGRLRLPRTNLAGSTPLSSLFMLMNIRENYLED